MTWWLCAIVVGVAAGAYGWLLLINAVLSDVEAERLELSASGRRCGLSPRS